MQIGVHKVAMAAPNDVSELARLIDAGTVNPSEIVALIGKTEGNGGANDFTRGFATLSYQMLLAKHLGISPEEVGKRVAFVWSGGTEGVLSPHATVFTRAAPQGKASGPRLGSDPHRPSAWHPCLHVAGTGGRPTRSHESRQRHLFARGNSLPVAHRAASIPGAVCARDTRAGPARQPDHANPTAAEIAARPGDDLPEMPGEGAGAPLYLRRRPGRGSAAVRRW